MRRNRKEFTRVFSEQGCEPTFEMLNKALPFNGSGKKPLLTSAKIGKAHLKDQIKIDM